MQQGTARFAECSTCDALCALWPGDTQSPPGNHALSLSLFLTRTPG